MLVLKTITLKNFLSTGAVTQTIDLVKPDLTLILGENLDLGGNAARNGVGKCVSVNTMIKIRNKTTGEISELTIGEFYALAEKNRNNINSIR